MSVSLVRPGLAVAAVALVAACGSSGSGHAGGSTSPSPAVTPSMSMPASSPTTTGPTATADGTEPKIHIKGFQFSAPSAPISAGEKFLVINDDSVAHTYETVQKGIFDSGSIDPNGGQKEVTAGAAGTYQIKCDFHPSMHGTLTIS